MGIVASVRESAFRAGMGRRGGEHCKSRVELRTERGSFADV